MESPEQTDRSRWSKVDLGAIAPAILGIFGLVVLGAVAIQVIDHYSRLSEWLVLLSASLLVAATMLLLFFSRAAYKASHRAEVSDLIRERSTALASYGVITVDREATIVEWNEASTDLFGRSREDAVGSEVFDLIIAPDQSHLYRHAFQELVNGDDPGVIGGQHEVRAIDANGRVFPIEILVARISEEPPLFSAFARNLTEERIREEENRRLAAIVRSSEDAIFSVDVEGRVTFWNEGARKLYGYTSGEVMHRRLTSLIIPPERAQELGSTFRKVITGASGVLDTERITKSGEEIRVSSRTFPIKDVDGNVVGMSFVSQDMTAKHRLQEKAAENKEKALWQERIEKALETSNFVFWGQPVFDVETGELHHTELLIRMEVDGRIAQPDEFLPHAESSDLINRIDSWAISHGITLARNMPVAINLSGRSLATLHLDRVIADNLNELGTDPGNVTFEITETAAVENMTAAHDLVADINRIGCAVSLDDFGTGYGSFTYVRHLPVAEIKIDQTFIRELLVEEASRRVIESIVDIARSFRVRTVAEGIEDEETLAAVKEMGIDLGQGYFLGRPEPVVFH